MSKITHAIIVVDESGSMASDKQLTIDAVNNQLEMFKANEDKLGKTFVSLYTFNSTVSEKFKAKPAYSVEPLTATTYNPSGGTALWDAIGVAIYGAMNYRYGPEDDVAFLVSVFTDGDENVSQIFTSNHLSYLIQNQEKLGNWTVSLMGDINGVGSMADLLKLNKGNVMGIQAGTSIGKMGGFQTMNAAYDNYFKARSVGATALSTFYSDVTDQPQVEIPVNTLKGN